MRIKKTTKARITISLSLEAAKMAQEQAVFFGGNLSAYLAHLIRNDGVCKGKSAEPSKAENLSSASKQ